MIDVEEAVRLVADYAESRTSILSPVAESLGLCLDEEIVADIDSPPYDKALVDGYAVVAEDLANGPTRLHIIEEVTAGFMPSKTVEVGRATRIMTGAPMPAGADAVVMIERTKVETVDQIEFVNIQQGQVQSGQNIMRRGASMRRGQVVVPAGTLLRPIEVGLAAEVGRTQVRVVPRPTVAVISTGDELVPADERPSGGQIRNSNGPMLCALAVQAGGTPTNLGIGRDQFEVLKELIDRALQCDIVVLSGGVSAGVKDLVPSVLAALDVQQVFHKVSLRPGKPLWFGVRSDPRGARLVFGLPGNPVSSLVCFHLFVRLAVRLLSGRDGLLPECTAGLARAHVQRGERATYWPARLENESGQQRVDLLDWRGSADLCTLAQANCLAFFPPGERTYEKDQQVRVVAL